MGLAVLFAELKGTYSQFPHLDIWDESRDARTYAGDLPVIAHPPCQLWTNLACVNFKRWGGEHNRPGNDGGCFVSALSSVRRCGGVLEHPAFSRAWPANDLPKPHKGWLRVNARDWGLRSLAKCLWASCQETHLAVIQWYTDPI